MIESTTHSGLKHIQVKALALVCFSLPLLIWPGLTDYNYAKTIAALVGISALLILWGAAAWQREGWTIRISWTLIPLSILVLASAVSLVSASSGRMVIQSLVLLTYFVLLLTYIESVVQDWVDVRWILSALVTAGVIAAVYGLLQYFLVLPGGLGATGPGVAISTIGNRDHLAGFLLYLFYPSAILLLRSPSRWQKLLVLLAMTLLFTTMLIVQQTGVRIAFTIVMGCLVAGTIVLRVAPSFRVDRWWFVSLAGLLIAASLFVFSLPQFEPEPDIMPSSQDQDAGSWLASELDSDSARARMWDWWIGLDMFMGHPLTGVGLGNYKVAFIASRANFLATERGTHYDTDFKHASQAHNEYVQVAAETGMLGVIALIASLATLAYVLWVRMRQASAQIRLELLLLSAGILTILIHGLVSFPAHVVGSSLALITLCGIALSPAYGTAQTLTLKLRGLAGRGIHVGLSIVALGVATLAICDAHANTLMERGIAQVQAGEFESGESALQESLKYDFAPRQTYYYLAVAQIQLGKLDDAQRNLEMCMTRFVDEAALLNYGNLLVNTGQSQQALEPLSLLLRSGPRTDIEPRARYLYALALTETGHSDTGISMIYELMSDYPRFETPYIGLGNVYASLERWDEAREAYSAGLALIASLESEIEAAIQQAGASIPPDQSAFYTGQLHKLASERAVLLDRLAEIP